PRRSLGAPGVPRREPLHPEAPEHRGLVRAGAGLPAPPPGVIHLQIRSRPTAPAIRVIARAVATRRPKPRPPSHAASPALTTVLEPAPMRMLVAATAAGRPWRVSRAMDRVMASTSRAPPSRLARYVPDDPR